MKTSNGAKPWQASTNPFTTFSWYSTRHPVYSLSFWHSPILFTWNRSVRTPRLSGTRWQGRLQAQGFVSRPFTISEGSGLPLAGRLQEAFDPKCIRLFRLKKKRYASVKRRRRWRRRRKRRHVNVGARRKTTTNPGYNIYPMQRCSWLRFYRFKVYYYQPFLIVASLLVFTADLWSRPFRPWSFVRDCLHVFSIKILRYSSRLYRYRALFCASTASNIRNASIFYSSYLQPSIRCLYLGYKWFLSRQSLSFETFILRILGTWAYLPQKILRAHSEIFLRAHWN